jgi:dipeptidyl aminopeptidase/acylaminoacyl peptidase
MRSVLRPLAMAIVVLVASNAPAQDRRPPTIDDLLNLVQVSGAEISPDGKHVIYTKSELKKWSDNKRVTSIWVASADGTDHHQLLSSDAASLEAMVSDWSSEYAMGFNHDISRWYIGGRPWDNAEAYRRQSAYTHIAKVATPTLLLHGEQDDTDTIGQSMIFYQGLKDRGMPTRFIRFPRAHGFREPHQSAFAMRRRSAG